MEHQALHNVMFWVGAMFVFTPLLVVASVIVTTRCLRKKREQADYGTS